MCAKYSYSTKLHSITWTRKSYNTYNFVNALHTSNAHTSMILRRLMFIWYTSYNGIKSIAWVHPPETTHRCAHSRRLFSEMHGKYDKYDITHKQCTVKPHHVYRNLPYIPRKFITSFTEFFFTCKAEMCAYHRVRRIMWYYITSIQGERHANVLLDGFIEYNYDDKKIYRLKLRDEDQRVYISKT